MFMRPSDLRPLFQEREYSPRPFKNPGFKFIWLDAIGADGSFPPEAAAESPRPHQTGTVCSRAEVEVPPLHGPKWNQCPAPTAF